MLEPLSNAANAIAAQSVVSSASLAVGDGCRLWDTERTY